jgi:NADPH:quinone reductase-like Zn-dependent oxidoreductase
MTKYVMCQTNELGPFRGANTQNADDMDLGLKGKAVLVAGGSSGIGRAVAIEMAASPVAGQVAGTSVLAGGGYSRGVS